MRKKAIAIYMTLIMLGLTACSQTEAANMDLQPESKTAEGNIALTEVNSQDVAHVIHEQHVEQEMNEESGQDGSGDMSEYIEVNPEFEGEPDIYDEAHGFRDDMSDEEPEGAESYEIDEAEPLYRVNIRNINVMSDVYNDYENCNLLRLAIQNYLDMCAEDPGAYYNVELVEGSCKDGEIMTFDAHVDELYGIPLHIEYDKENKQFGIDSDLMDASLKELEKIREGR